MERFQHVLKKQTTHLKNGFTLIEIMVSITIVGILTAITVPSYQSYLIKSKVSTLLTLAGPMQLEVEKQLVTGTTIGADIDASLSSFAAQSGVSTVSSYPFTNGPTGGANITVDMTQFGATGTLCFSLMGTLGTNGVVTWQCLGDTVYTSPASNFNYLPTTCLKASGTAPS